MDYQFQSGTQVHPKGDFQKHGEVAYHVPGNGSFPWAVVQWEDGTESVEPEHNLERD